MINYGYSFKILIYVCFASILIFFITKFNIYSACLSFILLFFLVFILPLSLSFQKYRIDYSKYLIDCENFPYALEAYESKKYDFEVQMIDFRKRKEILDLRMNDKRFVFQERINYIERNNLLYSAKPRLEYKNKNKGASEDFFLNFLTRYFKDEIYTDHVIEIFQKKEEYIAAYDIFYGEQTAYVPDFVFIHNKSHLTIDIEIDEPYHKQIPIHYIANTHDKLRNQYFSNKGVIIIRFSEEQVLNNPVQCCYEIAFLIYHFTSDDSYKKLFTSKIRIYRHKRWTYKQAQKLIDINFRRKEGAKIEELLHID